MGLISKHWLAMLGLICFVAAATFCSASSAHAIVLLGTANLAHSNTVAISNGLVGYWPLDGAVTNWNTNTTLDISSNGNTGTLVNLGTTTSPVGGKIGQALKFNGTTDYVDAGTGNELLGSWSLSAWVNMPSLNNGTAQVIVGRGRPAAPSTRRYVLFAQSNQFRLARSDGPLSLL
jgi:hypothetical protein